MKNKIAYLFLASLLITDIITNIAPIETKASNTLQSTGKLKYSDEVIIDTADHEVLQSNINDLHNELNNTTKPDWANQVDISSLVFNNGGVNKTYQYTVPSDGIISGSCANKKGSFGFFNIACNGKIIIAGNPYHPQYEMRIPFYFHVGEGDIVNFYSDKECGNDTTFSQCFFTPFK